MIKYFSFFAIIICSALTVSAQVTVINGISKRTGREPVKLFSVMQGQMMEVAVVTPAANGAFSFTFKPLYKGYYLVGVGNVNNGIQDKFKVYVKGDDQINLELTDLGYILAGKNNKENQVLQQWYKTAYKLERKTVYFDRGPRSFAGFFPILEETVEKARNWSNLHQTGNMEFDALMKNTVDYDLGYYALTLLLYPTASKPREEDYSPYVRNFDADQFLQDEILLRFPYGLKMLGHLVAFKNRGLDTDFDSHVMSIPNDRLKGDYALAYAATAKSYARFAEIAAKYGKYFVREDQQSTLAAIESKINIYKTGVAAINFTYPDVKGKQVSLADFKGKVVLVDIWATWCGPCVKEIPSLKQLEQEFHGQDVVFVSISVDDPKDKKVWEKFIVDKQLGGVQLFAGAKAQIKRDYKISGIPRFMLFDKQGKIIDVDSPRPSDPELKEILIKYLQ